MSSSPHQYTKSSSSSEDSSSRPYIAGPMVRLTAIVYDFLLVAAIVLVIQVVLTVVGTSLLSTSPSQAALLPKWYSYGIMFPAAVFAIWSFYAVFWAKAGQTLGMQTWHLKLVTANGQLPNHTTGYFRCAMAMIVPVFTAFFSYFATQSKPLFVTTFLFGFVLNHLFAYTNSRRMALQDILSGTVVLKMPSPKLRLNIKK